MRKNADKEHDTKKNLTLRSGRNCRYQINVVLSTQFIIFGFVSIPSGTCRAWPPCLICFFMPNRSNRNFAGMLGQFKSKQTWDVYRLAWIKIDDCMHNYHLSVLSAIPKTAQKRCWSIPQTVLKRRLLWLSVWTNWGVGRVKRHRHEISVFWYERF